MIKLIASDMDGTFLDGNECVPEGSYDLVMRLRDAGIQFVASSGRRFDTLHELFEPVVDCMDFVASNGAQVMVAGELVDLEVFSHAAVKRLARVVDMFDTMHLALFDETRSYLLDDEARFEREVDKNLPNPVRVFDVPSPQTSILKASVYCDDAVMDMAYILTRELDDDFVFAPSGRKWIDVMQRGVSKATGIQQVLDAHGIQASEMMAFGDSMNDYEILRMAGTSVAMGNARSAIKQIATKVIGTRGRTVLNLCRRCLHKWVRSAMASFWVGRKIRAAEGLRSSKGASLRAYHQLACRDALGGVAVGALQLAGGMPDGQDVHRDQRFRQPEFLSDDRGVEAADPDASQAQVGGGQHHVVGEDGRVHMDGAHAVERALPRLLAVGAHDERERRVEHVRSFRQAGEPFLAGHLEDAHGLAVRGGRRDAGRFDDGVDVPLADGDGLVGAGRAALFGKVEKRHGCSYL